MSNFKYENKVLAKIEQMGFKDEDDDNQKYLYNLPCSSCACAEWQVTSGFLKRISSKRTDDIRQPPVLWTKKYKDSDQSLYLACFCNRMKSFQPDTGLRCCSMYVAFDQEKL